MSRRVSANLTVLRFLMRARGTSAFAGHFRVGWTSRGKSRSIYILIRAWQWRHKSLNALGARLSSLNTYKFEFHWETFVSQTYLWSWSLFSSNYCPVKFEFRCGPCKEFLNYDFYMYIYFLYRYFGDSWEILKSRNWAWKLVLPHVTLHLSLSPKTAPKIIWWPWVI